MPETILLVFIVAKLKGYRIKPLFKSWTIYPVMIIELATLIGQISTYFGQYKIIEVINGLTSVYFIMHLFLILRYELYVQAIIGSFFILAGGILNDIAIKANEGFMPVYQSISYFTGRVTIENYQMVNDIHIIGNSQTKVKILTDFIDLGYTILSIGDVLMRVFVFLIIFNAIKKINNQRRKRSC